jgi:hypothetical protein
MQVLLSAWPLTNAMATVVVLAEVTRWIFQTQPRVLIHCIMYCGGKYFYAKFFHGGVGLVGVLCYKVCSCVTDLLCGNDFTKCHSLIACGKRTINIRIHFGSKDL